MRSQTKKDIADKPLFDINTYFAKAKFSPLAKRKREESEDKKELSIMLLYKQIQNIAEKSMDCSKPTFLLNDKSMDRPKKGAKLVVVTNQFRDSHTGAEYLPLPEKDPMSGIKSGAFKKKLKETQLNTEKNSVRLNKKKSIQKFFASKQSDNQTTGKNSGTEPTLTKRMPNADDLNAQKAKFLTDSMALASAKAGINSQYIFNAKFDQMRTEADKHTNYKKKAKDARSIEPNSGLNPKQAKISLNKERKKNSVQLVRSNTQMGHQKTVSHNAIFCTKILDLLKKNKVMETSKPKLDVLRSKGIGTFNNLINIGETRRTTTQKTETGLETPQHQRLNTKMTMSPDKRSQVNRCSVAKKTKRPTLVESKEAVMAKSLKSGFRSKHHKTLSSNNAFTKSTTNIATLHLDADHFALDKAYRDRGLTEGETAPKFSIRKSYKRAKTNASEPTSRLTSIERTSGKKKSTSKDMTGRKSSKSKSKINGNMLQFINNIDTNQYLESLKAKLTGELTSTKRQISLKSKLSLQNTKLLTLIGKFGDAGKNVEQRQKFKTSNNSKTDANN